jgi:hypothetical protein
MDESANKGKKLKVIKKKRGMKLKRCSASIPEPKASGIGRTSFDARDDGWFSAIPKPKYSAEYEALIRTKLADNLAKERDAAIQEPKASDIGRITVMGFEGHDREGVKSALREHFASCGKISDVYINLKTKNPIVAHIYFVGEGAVEKALKLNGSEVAGGWKVSAKPYPFYDDNPILVKIRGYEDTWLSDGELEVAVREFFSSCGEVKQVVVHKENGGFCCVDIKGIDAAEKVPELDGSFFGRNKAVVRVLTLPPRHSTHNRARNYGPRNLGLLAANHTAAETAE